MGGGGKGGSSGPSPADITNANAAYQGGFGFGSRGESAEGNYDIGSPWAPYWEQGFGAGQQQWQQQQWMSQFGEMMGGFEGGFEPSGPSYEEQMEMARIERGKAKRDAGYTAYMDASSAATDYVNSEINKEISNANLLGIHYDITDEMKQARIENYFASIWGEGEDAEVRALVEEFGEPTGFEGWFLNRGDASLAEGGETEGDETVVSRTGIPARPPTAGQNEEDLLGTAGILG